MKPLWCSYVPSSSVFSSFFFQFTLGICEAFLIPIFQPDITISSPQHQFSDQQALQMVYCDQIYQGGRLYLIEEGGNCKFLKIVTFFIDGIRWQNANVNRTNPQGLLIVTGYLSIYLSIHLFIIYHLSSIYWLIYLNVWKKFQLSIVSLDQY